MLLSPSFLSPRLIFLYKPERCYLAINQNTSPCYLNSFASITAHILIAIPCPQPFPPPAANKPTKHSNSLLSNTTPPHPSRHPDSVHPATNTYHDSSAALLQNTPNQRESLVFDPSHAQSLRSFCHLELNNLLLVLYRYHIRQCKTDNISPRD